MTIRRVKLQGGKILNQRPATATPVVVVRDTTFEPAPGQPYTPTDLPAIGEGGYTAEDVEVIRIRGEGFRASDCGPVRIENSYASVLGDDPGCDRSLHSDGLQGYNARGLELENATLVFGNECGTAPFFIPAGQGNTGNYTIHHLLVRGAGYSFRMARARDGAPACESSRTRGSTGRWTSSARRSGNGRRRSSPSTPTTRSRARGQEAAPATPGAASERTKERSRAARCFDQ